MLKYKNLILVGTSHIAKQSLREVREAIENEKPGIIALELDVRRAYALMHKVEHKLTWRDIRKVGWKGFLFGSLGAWAEEKLGAKVGVKPGSEMKLAIKLAQQRAIQLAFIDQDIEVTLRKLSKAFTWKEKWALVKDIFGAAVLRKKQMAFDLSKVPSHKIIEKLTKRVKKQYPNIYKVLISERNRIMAKRLAALMKNYPNKTIVAIVGAGHEVEILGLIKKHLKST